MLLLAIAPLGFFRTHARPVELENHRVMDESIDRGRGGHRVLEDAVPLLPRQVDAAVGRVCSPPA